MLHDGMHAVCTFTKLGLFTKPRLMLIRYGKELSYMSLGYLQAQMRTKLILTLPFQMAG